MAEDQQHLETLDAAISRVMDAIENGPPDADVREKLEKELAILAALRLEMVKKPPRLH
jgi:hypothetical protein